VEAKAAVHPMVNSAYKNRANFGDCLLPFFREFLGDSAIVFLNANFAFQCLNAACANTNLPQISAKSVFDFSAFFAAKFPKFENFDIFSIAEHLKVRGGVSGLFAETELLCKVIQKSLLE
jgi:DNA polymerase III alpha subunit (gram-positive type)